MALGRKWHDGIGACSQWEKVKARLCMKKKQFGRKICETKKKILFYRLNILSFSFFVSVNVIFNALQKLLNFKQHFDRLKIGETLERNQFICKRALEKMKDDNFSETLDRSWPSKGKCVIHEHSRYPLEMHIFHFNTKYKNFETAIQFEDGVVAAAFLYKISQNGNPGLKFLEGEMKFAKAGHRSRLKSENLASVEDLFAGVDLESFYSYHGSLTRPPCYNTVTWIVFDNPIGISHQQVRYHKTLHE